MDKPDDRESRHPSSRSREPAPLAGSAPREKLPKFTCEGRRRTFSVGGDGTRRRYLPDECLLVCKNVGGTAECCRRQPFVPGMGAEGFSFVPAGMCADQI